jgi:phosphate transport system protein
MSKHLQSDLEALKKSLLTMGALVEESLEKAASALLDRKAALASEVIAGDEKLDRLEVEIEEECLKILALHQPVAHDLRFVAAVMKINNDLERMGDAAVNIAERAEALAREEAITLPPLLKSMVRTAVAMTRESLQAFVGNDPQAARRICVRDEEVDRENREVISQLQKMMAADPGLVDRCLHAFSASRHVERIADHATNIAEDVVYMVEGDIIRHLHGQKNEEK